MVVGVSWLFVELPPHDETMSAAKIKQDMLVIFTRGFINLKVL